MKAPHQQVRPKAIAPAHEQRAQRAEPVRRPGADPVEEQHAERRADRPGGRREQELARLGADEVAPVNVVHDIKVERDVETRRAEDANQHARELAADRLADEQDRRHDETGTAQRIDPASADAADQQRNGEAAGEAGQGDREEGEADIARRAEEGIGL
jgi:hypothetical protein